MEQSAAVPILQSNDFEKEESAAKRVDSFMDEVSEFREAGAPDARPQLRIELINGISRTLNRCWALGSLPEPSADPWGAPL